MTSPFSVGVIQSTTGQQERQYGVQAMLAPRRVQDTRALGPVRRIVTSVQQEVQYYLKEAPGDYIRSLQKAGSSANYTARLEGARTPETDNQPAIVQMHALRTDARGQDTLNPDFILEHIRQLEEERARLAAGGGEAAARPLQDTRPAGEDTRTDPLQAAEETQEPPGAPDPVDCDDPVQAVRERECIYRTQEKTRDEPAPAPQQTGTSPALIDS